MDDFEGSYAPQSPDLSGLKDSYAPQSPDLSGLNDFDEPDPFSNSNPLFPPSSYQPSYPQQSTNHDPYSYTHPSAQTSDHYQQSLTTSNNEKMRTHPEDDGDFVFEPAAPKVGGGRKPKKPKVEEEVCAKPAPGVVEGIDVKTKFPVARIKRIMQADEDVGKVAQVTPTAVSKALELFMISVVTKAGDVARAKSSKRVTPAHLKQAVQHDDQFDFLADIIAKVSDAPASKKKDETEDSDEAMSGSKKKKRSGTKRRKDDDDL